MYRISKFFVIIFIGILLIGCNEKSNQEESNQEESITKKNTYNLSYKDGENNLILIKCNDFLQSSEIQVFEPDGSKRLVIISKDQMKMLKLLWDNISIEVYGNNTGLTPGLSSIKENYFEIISNSNGNKEIFKLIVPLAISSTREVSRYYPLDKEAPPFDDFEDPADAHLRSEYYVTILKDYLNLITAIP